ncbi:recE [Nocardia cyriacigeorgica]|uniref:PD-(D/E)XK nuclease-like domain-containing protein n=1 Tax=Nocardia cyriacigeorgica TaxID=135487 RepID=UPI0013BAA9FF|nr:PD-(D/E)XK nuclease-like domain-containing protein [Nocardia cyriacigeorgica]NEW49378.1 recE [Nocardia cyriacigeorgica]
MSAPTEEGVYDDIDEAVYHADLDSLSSSAARELLEVSPAEWMFARQNPRTTVPDHYLLGSAVHTLVLGAGADISEVAADDWRTAKARKRKADAIKAGRIPLLTEDVLRAEDMAQAVYDHPVAGRLFSTGRPEVSAYARDEQTGEMLRARADWIHTAPTGRRVGVDLKTADSANPVLFAKEVAKFGYFCQQPWYEDVFDTAGEPLDAFLFVVVAKTCPHLVSVMEIRPEAVDLGRIRNRRAIDLWARCRASGQWPTYGADIHQIDLPPWTYKQEAYQ